MQRMFFCSKRCRGDNRMGKQTNCRDWIGNPETRRIHNDADTHGLTAKTRTGWKRRSPAEAQYAIHVHPTRTRNDANKNWSSRAITATKQSLDWAFVEVEAADETTYDNEDRNKLPLATSPGLYRKNASSYGHDLPEYYADETDHEIKDFSEIQKGHWYCKAGRTTDTTTGICHGTGLLQHHWFGTTNKVWWGECLWDWDKARNDKHGSTGLVIWVVYHPKERRKAGGVLLEKG